MADQNLRSLPDPRPPGDYPHTTALLTYALILTLTFLTAQAGKSLVSPAQAQVPHSPIVSPSPTVEPTPNPEPTYIPVEGAYEDPRAQKEKIIGYIKTIFGSNAKTACAIALAESGVNYKGERVFNVGAVRRSEVETSIGLFQINLKGKETLVHWHRVPGQTETEKIDWLNNPYNNTLMAYWIYSTHNNFEPWSVFSDGTYLAYAK